MNERICSDCKKTFIPSRRKYTLCPICWDNKTQTTKTYSHPFYYYGIANMRFMYDQLEKHKDEIEPATTWLSKLDEFEKEAIWAKINFYEKYLDDIEQESGFSTTELREIINNLKTKVSE